MKFKIVTGALSWLIVVTLLHVMLNVGVGLPVTDAGVRSKRIMVYLLWDWYDGGLFDGW